MSRKIESLLRVISDIHHFEIGEMPTQKLPDELAEDELDLVAAAAHEATISDFMRREK